MHLFIFSACIVTPSTAWEWFMSSPVPGVAQITLWFSCIMPSPLLSSRLPISRPYTGCTRRRARVPSGASCGPRSKPSPCQRCIHRRRLHRGHISGPDRLRNRELKSSGSSVSSSWESSVANSHRLVVCLRASPVIFSARHQKLLLHVR